MYPWARDTIWSKFVFQFKAVVTDFVPNILSSKLDFKITDFKMKFEVGDF